MLTDIFNRVAFHERAHGIHLDHVLVNGIALAVYKGLTNWHLAHLAWCHLANTHDIVDLQGDALWIALDQQRLINHSHDAAPDNQHVLDHTPDGCIKVVDIKLILQTALQHG